MASWEGSISSQGPREWGKKRSSMDECFKSGSEAGVKSDPLIKVVAMLPTKIKWENECS